MLDRLLEANFHQSDAALADVRGVLERHGAQVQSMGHPTTTLEELFLRVVRESEAHPGRRVRGGSGDAA